MSKELGIQFNNIQIPPEGMERSPWSYASNPGYIDADKIKNLEVDTITVSESGFIRSGKKDFNDTDAGWYLSQEGVYIGSDSDASRLKYDVDLGTFDFIGTVSGQATNALAYGDSSGNLTTDVINDRINTSSRQILDGFTFGTSGAIQIGEYTAGTSGDIKISPNGIVGRNSSNIETFSINGVSGEAMFRGSVVITGGSGYNNLTDKPTLGSLAAKNSVGTGDVDTTIISGGKIVTGLLTANNIQTGTLSVSSLDTAIHVKSGGNILIDGASSNSGKIVFRDGSSTTKKWELFMETGINEEWLVLEPSNITYRDVWLGRYGFSGTNTEKTSTAIRNFFVKTGNTLSSGSRPSISFENWNAYGGYFSSILIGNSDTESVISIRGNTKPMSDNEFDLGSQGTNNNWGWRRLYIGNQGNGSKYFYGTTVTEDTAGFPTRQVSATNVRFLCSGLHTPVGGYFQIGLDKYQPTTLNYKDHSNVNRSMNVLAKIF